MALTLGILSLNVWGIPLISKDKDFRISQIAEKIAQSDYDIVSLQEVSILSLCFAVNRSSFMISGVERVRLCEDQRSSEEQLQIFSLLLQRR